VELKPIGHRAPDGLGVAKNKPKSQAVLSPCVASRMWVRHRSVVMVPPNGGLESRTDPEMCECFIYVTLKLVSATTQGNRAGVNPVH